MNLYLDLRKASQLGLFDQPPKPAAKPAAAAASKKFEPGQVLTHSTGKYKVQNVRRDGSSMTVRKIGADGKLTGPVKRVNPAMFSAEGSAPAAPKPAAAWQGVPNSKVPGAQRKREGGKWVYRYPQPGGGWGTSPHKPEEKPTHLEGATKVGTPSHIFVDNAAQLAAARKEKLYGKDITAVDIQAHKDVWLPGVLRDYHLGATAGMVAHDIAIRTKGAMMRAAEQRDADARKKAMLGTPPPPESKPKKEPPPPAKDGKHVDVGEKIGMARKDLAAMSRADFEDLEKDPTAAYKMTTRQAVFGNYDRAAIEADREAGTHVAVAWWKARILSSIQVRPPDSREARDLYHKAAKRIQEAFARAKSPEDLVVFLKEWRDEVISATTGTAHIFTDVGKSDGAQMTKVLGRRFAELAGFQTAVRQRRHKPGDFSMYTGYTTSNGQRKAAREFRQQVADTSPADRWNWAGPKKKKPGAKVERDKGFVFHRDIGQVERRNLPEVPGGQTGKDMMKAFGLRGVEYGNWASDSERQWHTEMCHASFKDLAGVLGIPEEQISMNGRLAIGFGSRGKGGAHAAAAHYEPARRVINITKMNGNGTLAHEWGHFMDNAISRSYNPGVGKVAFVSDGSAGGSVPSEITNAMQAVMNEIKTEKLTPDQVLELRRKRDDLREQLAPLREQIRIHRTSRKVKDDAFYKRDRELVESHNEIVNALKALPSPRSDGTVESAFYAAAKNLGKYWGSDVELFGRAFESYVESKLQDKGQRSSYLVAGTLNGYRKPSGEMVPGVYIPHTDPHRKRVNAAMDKFIAVMKKHNQFAKSAVAWLMDLRKSERVPLYVNV